MNKEIKEKINTIREELKTKKIDAEIIYKLLEVGIDKDYIYSNYNNYKKIENITNKDGIFLIDYFKKIRKDENIDELKKRYEQFNDQVNKSLYNDKKKKLIKPISSSQYKHLFSNEGITTDSLFLELAMLDIDKNYIQDNIAKKIKSFKSSEDLNNALIQIIETFNSWDFNKNLKKIKESNVKILSSENNKIIFEVNDFESSAKLGSTMWCITRDNEMFKHYRDDLNRIVFCYDFNKKVQENDSKTAYIVNAAGNVNSGYYKDDSLINKIFFEKVENFIEKLNDNEVMKRFNNNNYSYEDIYLIKLFNDIASESDKNELKYKNFKKEIFKKYIKNENIEIIKKIIKENPELLINASTTKNEFLIIVTDFITTSYNEEVGFMLKSIMENKKLFNELKNIKEFELFQNPLDNFIFYKTQKNIVPLFNSYIENSKKELTDLIKESKNFHKDTYELLKKIDENIALKIKKKIPETAFFISTQFPIKTSFEFLEINKNDIELIKVIEKNIQKSNLNEETIFKILKELKNKDIEFLEFNTSNSIKNDIINNPRNITKYKEEILAFKIFFDENETLDYLSKLMFNESFNSIKNKDNDFICKKINEFKMPKPLLKILIIRDELDLLAKKTFIKFLEKSTKNINKHDFSNIDNNLKSFIELTENKEIKEYLSEKKKELDSNLHKKEIKNKNI